MFTLRRIMWQKLPSPMAEVSPSPEIPSGIMAWLPTLAPVATEAMRPCTALMPNAWFMK